MATRSRAVTRPVACQNCRRRRSYCSKEKPMCSRCRDAGLTCTYGEARKITVNESYLRVLEWKAKAYDGSDTDAFKGTKPPELIDFLDVENDERLNESSTMGRARPPAEENDEDSGDEKYFLEPFSHITIKQPLTSFKGPGSSDNFLKNVRRLSGLCGEDESLDADSNFYDPSALPSRRESSRVQIRLPPPAIARRFFTAQYTYIGTIFAFTDPPGAFYEQLTEAYRGVPEPSDRDACLLYAKVLVVLAFGQLYSVNQWVDFRGPPGFDYFTASLSLLPDAHEEGSVLCVETLALIGYFMQNMNRRDAAFLYIGMALRMAVSLGLHQEAGRELDSAIREHHRRVWWSVYSLDRILSVKSGNPITIQDEDISAEMPRGLPYEPSYCPAVALRHYTVLSRILGDIHSSIYRKAGETSPKSGRRLVETVQRIILALSKWNQELPDDLRFDPAKLSISRESVSTFSHYYQCINMTVRPLLFHIVQRRVRQIRSGEDPGLKERDWREGNSPSTAKVIDICIGGAQDVINMMTIAAEKDLVATYGYMDGEHVFSASIVLFMACVAFPTNDANTRAMNAGLELLRTMGERGNSYMGARYELLAELRASHLPGAVESDTASQGFSSNTGPGSTTRSSIAEPSPFSTEAGPVPAPKRNATSHEVGAPERLTFPMVNYSFLGEPFYDESINSGIDFGLWEEGFANFAVNAGFDYPQWSQAAAEVLQVQPGEDIDIP